MYGGFMAHHGERGVMLGDWANTSTKWHNLLELCLWNEGV